MSLHAFVLPVGNFRRSFDSEGNRLQRDKCQPSVYFTGTLLKPADYYFKALLGGVRISVNEGVVTACVICTNVIAALKTARLNFHSASGNLLSYFYS